MAQDRPGRQLLRHFVLQRWRVLKWLGWWVANHQIVVYKLIQCVKDFCHENFFLSAFLKSCFFPISFILKWEHMLHKLHQTRLSATDSQAVDYSPFLYHWFLMLNFSLVERYKSKPHICMADSVYISRLPVPSTFCTRSFGHIQQMAKLSTW